MRTTNPICTRCQCPFMSSHPSIRFAPLTPTSLLLAVLAMGAVVLGP